MGAPHAKYLARPTRIGVVIGTRFYRECMVQILRRERWLEVVDLSDLSGAALTRGIVSHRPAVVLVDLPIELLRAMVGAIDGSISLSRIIALAPNEEDDGILPLLGAGLSGVVPREASVRDLIDSMIHCLRGDLGLPPRTTQALLTRLLVASGSHGRRSSLTAREAEIAELLARHLTNKEIAIQLGIEAGTVKGHVHHLLAKLGVRRRSEVAHRCGLKSQSTSHC